jgi:hypothetical protein
MRPATHRRAPCLRTRGPARESVTTARRHSRAAAIGLALAGSSCLRDQTLDPNRAPLANAGEDQELEWKGDPVMVKLDASKSRDLDGTITGYDWRLVRATNAADAGIADAGGDVDAGGSANSALDPENVAEPEIMLDRGHYLFTLWVRDDRRAISKPDTVSIRVGGDPIEECISSSPHLLEDACRQCLCNEGDPCTTAVPACGNDCWRLIGCIAVYCPTFTMDNDIACVATHCGPFIAEGQAAATEAGGCIAPCATECGGALTAVAGEG